MSDIDVQLKLSAQRALWGNVTPPLRHASIELKDNKIVWQCIYDGDAIEDDLELMSDSAAEILGDFSSDYGYEEIIVIRPFPEKIEYLKNLIYFRNENNYYKD